MRGTRAATVAAAVLAMVASPATASAGGGGDDEHDDVTTLAEGLSGPRQLDEYRHGRLVVAESDSGEVSSVDPDTGRVRTLLDGLPQPQGVGYDHGKLFVALGEAAPDDSGDPPPPRPDEAPRASTVLVAEPDGGILEEYDLLAYELEHNPDGQDQFAKDGSTPLDALSNPFAVHVQRHDVLVADAGANAVLSIDRHSGKIRTFFVPPVVGSDDVPECADGNPEQTVDGDAIDGCDPVPTGVTERDGLIYVSTLGAEVEGAARVYVLTQEGEVVDVHDDLTGLTGIEVDRKGNIYVSELLEGAAALEPPADGTEPPPPTEEEVATVGQIITIEPDGDREYAQVTLPTGLEIDDGRLYASAWSIAGFVGFPDRGEVVTVPRGAFD